MKYKEHKLSSQKTKHLLKLIKNRLPKKSQILVLSLSPNGTFGRRNERLNYNIINGIFACKNYWGTLKLNKNGFNINLHELEYVGSYIPDYLPFEFFQNITNPIYIHPKFDYKGLISFCSFISISEPINELIIIQSNYHFNLSSALSCYQALLIPLYFLETKKIKTNIFKINKKYKLKMLSILMQITKTGVYPASLGEKEKKIIKYDIEKLLKKFRKLKEKLKNEKIDTEKLEKWREKANATFY